MAADQKNVDKDYVLGTHDAEIERLGLQHRIWRPRVLDAWQRAGFSSRQTLVDIGAGPGHATMDLAEITGPGGRVVAIDRSRRFLDHLNAMSRSRGFDWIETIETDLDTLELPPRLADGAWARWIFAFVQQPRRLVERVREVLKPGGVAVFHEYIDYSTWRLAPRSEEFEAFVQLVMQSWRASGGEPDIGLDLPAWLTDLGFEVQSLRPILDIVPPSHPIWEWPKSFVVVGVERLVDLGLLASERAQRILADFEAAAASPHSLLVTPAMLEIIAVRRS